MKVTQEPQEERQTILSIELEPPEVERHLDQASRRLAQRLKVPGFRPGKAPRWMVERLVGKEGLLDEAIESLVPEATQRALEQEKLDWSAPPSVEVAQREPLTLKATVPLTPVLELGDYRSLRVPEDPVEVDESEVDKALESLRREQAPWEPVERPVELSDLVVLDFSGTVEGEPFFKQEGVPYVVSEDSDVPLPGFGKAVVGMALQEEREFDLDIPSDYPEPKVAGKPCHVKVKINEIKAQRLSELNDEFAKGVGQGFESLAALREQLRGNISRLESDRAKRAYEEKVIQAALDQATVVVPPLTVKHNAEHMLQERAEGLARQGINIEDVLARSGKTLENYRTELEQEARKSLLTSLLLRKLADAENIQVDGDAVAKDLADLARQVQERSGGRQRVRDNEQSREALGRMQRTRKALERLVAIAQGKGDEPGRQPSAKGTPAQPGESEEAPGLVETSAT